MKSLLQRNTSLKKYIKEIDGLRFLAILLVVLMHLSERLRKFDLRYSEEHCDGVIEYMLSRGTVGVFLFFALSGFILGLPIAKSLIQGKGPKPYKSYIAKRILRIEPPFVFWMSVFTIVLFALGSYEGGELFRRFLASIFYVHNIIYNEYSIINPVAWSLEVELQFYLLAPVLMRALYLIKDHLYRSTFLTALIMIHPIVEYVFNMHVMPYKGSLIGNLDYFLIGFLLIEVYVHHKQWLKSKSISWDIIGFVALILLNLLWSGEILKSMCFDLCLLTVMLAAFKGKYANRLLTHYTTIIIGGMCYTIYLVHLPLFELKTSNSYHLMGVTKFPLAFLFQLCISIPVLLLVVTFSYLLIEKPFMSSKPIEYYKSLFLKIRSNYRVVLNVFKAPLKSSYIILLLAVPAMAFGQSSTDVDLLKLELAEQSKIKLLPLQEIFRLAEQESPLLQSTQFSKENLVREISIVKNKWMDYISLTAAYVYGTSSFLDQSETVFAVDYSTLNRKSLFYHAGVNIRLPLSELVSRRHHIDKIKNEQKILDLQKEQMLAQLRKEIIHYYNEYHNKLKILEIKNEQLQSFELSSKYAEEALVNGQLDVVEYNKIITSYSQKQEEVEQSKSEILLAYIMLCELTGKNIRL